MIKMKWVFVTCLIIVLFILVFWIPERIRDIVMLDKKYSKISCRNKRCDVLDTDYE